MTTNLLTLDQVRESALLSTQAELQEAKKQSAEWEGRAAALVAEVQRLNAYLAQICSEERERCAKACIKYIDDQISPSCNPDCHNADAAAIRQLDKGETT